MNKVASLVDHFANNRGTSKLYDNAVTYQPSKHERERMLQVPTSAGVSGENPPENVSMLKQELRSNGVVDEEMIRFVFDGG